MSGQKRDARLELFAGLAEPAALDQSAVLARLEACPAGLAWPEAHRRLEEFGRNELTSQKPPSWLSVLWSSMKHPFNGVLAILAIVSFATGDPKATIVMSSMIVLSAGLRFWQEMKSQVQAESLRRFVRNEVTVLRAENAGVERKPNELDRQASDIPTAELVPDGMVKLSAADTIIQQSLFQSGWFVVGLLTQTLIVHMIRTEKIPFAQSTAAPIVVATTAAVMGFGAWLPFSPVAPVFRLEPLPSGYFIYLPLVLLAYCVLVQFVKHIYIRRFKSRL